MGEMDTLNSHTLNVFSNQQLNWQGQSNSYQTPVTVWETQQQYQRQYEQSQRQYEQYQRQRLSNPFLFESNSSTTRPQEGDYTNEGWLDQRVNEIRVKL
jgi:hypothetical protein